MILGDVTPMSHQADDVASLVVHPRINIWNGLGTGKTCTAAWILQKKWLAGEIDEVIVGMPSMCMRDWEETFTSLAWPKGLVEFIDCRPPDQWTIQAILASGRRPAQGKLLVMATTYAGIRSLFAEKLGSSRYKVNHETDHARGARGRRLAVVFDEAQATALPDSGQGHASRALSSYARSVISMTATPIGNPLELRLWGMSRLVRPDITERFEPTKVYGQPSGKRGSFNSFKARYAVLFDPIQAKAERAGRTARMVPGRSYPVNVHDAMIKTEVLGPMAPYTVRRTKEECLDLPPKVRMIRAFRLPEEAQRILDSIINDDRAVLESGTVIVPANILEERLRCLELCGGWIDGEPVHTGKLEIMRDVVDEVTDAEGDYSPIVVWASRSRELIGAACVAAGMKPDEAMTQASRCYPRGQPQADTKAYKETVELLERRKVGLIHGPTNDRDRDRVQTLWKSGSLRTVCAHPGVAGAGLNWQHVKATVYYGQPLGTIARQQSEDRVHRNGLKHTALYFDVVVEGGPDEAVAKAHAHQRDAERALLDWLVRQRSW